MLDFFREKFGGVLIFLLVVGFGVQWSESMPDNAIVYIDSKNKTFYGEPTALEEISMGHSLAKTTLKKAYDKNYKPDDLSRNRGDFVGYDRSILTHILAEIGILPNHKRWNPDGTWNY